ncbi:MAG: oligopeptide transport system substrate-binding protein [Flavobacterium sp.]|jgi:oligopeptide transport system substrate-binding protein
MTILKAFLSFLILMSCSLAKSDAIDFEKSLITLALTSEPPNLDSSLSTDTVSGLILRMTNERLVEMDKRGNIIPGVAERWVKEGLDVTFYLREDATWSDGKPVTAHDFVYAMRRLVNPASAANGSTFFAYIIDNALDILRGNKPPEQLGVQAVNDRELRVRLSNPTPYYLTVFSSVPYGPLRKDFVESQGGRFAADAKNTLSNGPYILASWTHAASLTLKKNVNYWNAQDINVDTIDFAYITSDTRSLLNLYKSNELASLRLNEDILKDTLEYGLRVQKAPTNCLNWIMLNLREDRPTHNLKLRKAIRLAIDRNVYTNTIVGLPGTRTVDSVFTQRMKGVEGSFQEEYPAPIVEFDTEKARRLVAEAKAELGIDKFPPLIMLINETRQIEAEFVQSQLINGLGLDVRVDKQTFKQSLVKMRTGEFDIARQGFCGGALRDPVFFAGIFQSESSFNDMGFKNEEYDRLMDLTHSTEGQLVRMQAFDKMQHIIYKEVPIIPTFESSWVYVQDRRLKGVNRYPIVNFSRANLVGLSQ